MVPTLRFATATLGVALAALPVRAAEAPPAARLQVKAARVAPGSIRVDGDADDAGWLLAEWNQGFVQVDPDEGKPPTEATRFKVAYDDHDLYVLVEAFDSKPELISALLSRRDQPSSSDWVHVLLDTFDDKRSAYRFQVNPLGVRIDARIGADNLEDANWDAVWEARTARFDKGWRVEYGIPLGQLRWPAGRATWGLQVLRVLQRRAETDAFSPMPRSEIYPVRCFGELDVRDLVSPWRLELSPYASAGVSSVGADLQPVWSLGLDARAGLGQSFTLDLTFNPDFGQVEADPSELNLTAVETFFSEKRPFFLEGADQFRFALGWGDMSYETLFYTRRIGRATQRDPAEAGEVREAPTRARIVGAAKLTGKTSDGWTVGALDAVTEAEFADIDVDHGRRRLLIEPFTQMAVLHVGHDFREGQTQVGLLATHAWRRLSFDSAAFFPEQAAAGGLDLDHRFSDWEVTLRLYGTHLRGSAEAIDAVQRDEVHFLQRPDADLGYDPGRTSLSGWGGMAMAGKLTGTTWRGAAAIWARSPGLDPNDLGYLPAADEQTALLWLQLRADEPGLLRRRAAVNFNATATRTFEGELTALNGNVIGTWIFPETSYLYAGAARKQTALDARALRGGPALQVPGAWSGWLGFGTDDRRRWTVGLDGDWAANDDHSGWTVWVSPWLGLRPIPSVEIVLIPGWRHQRSAFQWATNLAGLDGHDSRWFVGDLDRDTLSLTLRVSWALTSKLSFQWYAMPYLSAGTFAGFSEVVSARAERFPDRFAPVSKDFAASTLGISDKFVYAQVRSNLVLRWEFSAGSAAYLVWTHEQTDDRGDAGQLAWEDATHLSGQPSTDVVMAKLVWWWSR